MGLMLCAGLLTAGGIVSWLGLGPGRAPVELASEAS
jgi:hypothetical protein